MPPTYHLNDQRIPEGFQIFQERLEVAGISFRKDEAVAFVKARNGWLELERDPKNEYDPNAIKVIGCNEGSFGTERRFIGYVPRDSAKLIVEGLYLDQIRPRLLKTYSSDDDFVEILFQVLGPKGHKYEYLQTNQLEPDHYSGFVDRVEQLVSEKKYEDAIQLLHRLVGETEQEASNHGHGVAPWYYEKLAKIYRKQRRHDDEVAVLERFEAQLKSPGVGPRNLAQRLIKARHLRDSSRSDAHLAK